MRLLVTVMINKDSLPRPGFTTGRHPKFPVLLFDVTNNPYNPEEIRERVVACGIEWVILKNDLQIEADQTIDNKDQIFELLKPDFRHIESLNNYEIYKRRHPSDPPDDEDDDDNDDNGNSSDNVISRRFGSFEVSKMTSMPASPAVN